MSRSTIKNEILINDGRGNKLPIGTSTWVSSWINVEEQRRLSITLGVTSATGAPGDIGGFSGILQIQGTDELGQCNGLTGTSEAGNTNRPGINGWTGARFYSVIPSGTINITSTTGQPGNALMLNFNDVSCGYIRLAFNQSATGALAGSAGSGIMHVYLTAKNT